MRLSHTACSFPEQLGLQTAIGAQKELLMDSLGPLRHWLTQAILNTTPPLHTLKLICRVRLLEHPARYCDAIGRRSRKALAVSIHADLNHCTGQCNGCYAIVRGAEGTSLKLGLMMQG